MCSPVHAAASAFVACWDPTCSGIVRPINYCKLCTVKCEWVNWYIVVFDRKIKLIYRCNLGRAVAQAVSGWLPTTAARVRVRAAYGGLWWTKRHWGRFSPRTSVSPANHSTNFSVVIITLGWHSRPIGDRSAEWTQLDSTPHYTNLGVIP
jgi:hypothetical protein